MRKVFAVAAFVGMMASGAVAKTVTLEATINNILGSAELLYEFGISSGGTLKARFTIDDDLSQGASFVTSANYDYSILNSGYSDLTFSSSTKSVSLFDSNLAKHYVNTTNGIQDNNRDIWGSFTLVSNPLSSNPNNYYTFLLESLDYNHEKWTRTGP